MAYQTFMVQRSPFFSLKQLEQIEQTVYRLLEEVGISVLDPELERSLLSRGFKQRNRRVVIEKGVVSEFINEERKRNQNKFSEEPKLTEPNDVQISVYIIEYAQWVHDIDTDKIVPFDTNRLIEATKLLDMLSIVGVPGCPTDVHPLIQPIIQYYISAKYSRYGKRRLDAKSAKTLKYMIEMGEVLGDPLRGLPIYVFSPLTLGSESLRCVLEFSDKISYAHVSNMPSLGVTAPINVGDAFALSAAEVIGCSILLREIIDLPINWSMEVLPIDLRTLAMVFGSPENFLLQLAMAEVNAYFHGTEWHPYAGNIHTNAKLPGAQSCAEKSSLMTAGALLGARRFGSVGLLSLDEVFSAEQLIYDLEIRDHVQRLIKGLDTDCDPDRCLDDVQKASDSRSFIALETTLKNYRQFYWHPKIFDRQFLSAWQGQGAKSNREKAHAMIKELIHKHEYTLDSQTLAELDKIVAKAKSELVG